MEDQIFLSRDEFKQALKNIKTVTNGNGLQVSNVIPFDIDRYSCYKLATSPLFLRGQGARRLNTASAFLTAHITIRSKIQGET